ncbi:hypothetical protein vseg_002676 [Gypsophila vaccaria]
MSKETVTLPYLTEELVLDILCRLPIKSLVRFRAVCKNWRSLLSYDRGFASRYRSYNPATYGYLIKSVASEHDTHNFNFGLIRDSDLKLVDIIDDYLDHNNVTVIGSIDGVVCYIRGNNQFVVWNPSTRDSYRVPSPNILEDSINKSFFGFGRYNQDCGLGGPFSIARIVRRNCKHHWMGGDPYCCTPRNEAEFYNSISDSWTNIGDAPKSFLMCTDECSVVVGRTSYWCTYTWCASIISFSHSLNKFSEFDGPGSSAANSSLGWSLGEISGSLVALIQGAGGSVGVWKMVGDDGGGSRVTWVRLFCVARSSGVGKVVKCWRNGEFLVEIKSGHSNELGSKLSLYDPWTKEIRASFEFPVKKGRSYEAFSYVESLISPRGYAIDA